jgi:hypothetical protein
MFLHIPIAGPYLDCLIHVLNPLCKPVTSYSEKCTLPILDLFDNKIVLPVQQIPCWKSMRYDNDVRTIKEKRRLGILRLKCGDCWNTNSVVFIQTP